MERYMSAKEIVDRPVKYTEGIYYIGTRNSPSWLIKGETGLIMIDTAMPEDLDFILNNFKLLGYDICDVKHIIHSHGHIDHIGCTKEIVRISGAKTYIGYGDEDSVSGRNELQWTNEFNMPFDVAFEPDYVIKDGDERVIDGIKFRFVATPGHTAGVMSIFFTAFENGNDYTVGMFGGAGLLSMSYNYLDKYSLPHSLRDTFLSSIQKVYFEKVDIHIGNHIGDNCHFDKLSRVGTSTNPFIDGSTWKTFLDNRYKLAVDFFKEN